MKFVCDLDVKQFNDFVENHPMKSHFLQSSLWGELSQHKGLVPHYVGLEEDGELKAATLLLEKQLYLGYSYFYAPRGYVLDFNNYEVLAHFTDELKKYAKKEKAIFVKIDPDIKYHQINNEAKAIENGFNNYHVVTNLKKLGYKHRGFTKNFEGSQPRYTFRINLKDSYDNINSKFSVTTKQRIKKAKEYGVEVYIGDKSDVATFANLVFETEKRKNIYCHETDYYHKFYDIFNKNDNIKLFLGKVYPKKTLESLNKRLTQCKKELKEINAVTEKSNKILNQTEQLQKQIDKIKQDISAFKIYDKKYPKGVIVSGYMIVYYGDKAWVLYAGNRSDLTETNANYLVYEHHIRYAYEKGYRVYDLFGTIGDLSKDNPLLGLHEFKRKFAGEYTEFIGEFDLITQRFLYSFFVKVIPFYRKTINFKLRKRRKK
jgi:peptidoglycan pentaglycine glycine transferase (the first glycine)